jgi:hypothetical protein
MCMSDKFRAAWPEAIADDDAFPLWFVAKSSFLPKNRRKLLYQRTTGSSKRITMCSTNIPARTQMQSINSGKGHGYALNLKDSGIEVIAEISITPHRSEQIILMQTQSN